MNRGREFVAALSTVLHVGDRPPSAFKRSGSSQSWDPHHLPELDKKEQQRIELGVKRFRHLRCPDDFVTTVFHVDFEAVMAAGDDGLTLLQSLLALPPAMLRCFQVGSGRHGLEEWGTTAVPKQGYVQAGKELGRRATPPCRLA